MANGFKDPLRHFFYFTAFNCRYVTCDYYQWSSWSASCGIGMKRTRGLSKVNEHFIKRQGGCSGLKVTCDKQETETKTANCEFMLEFSRGSKKHKLTFLIPRSNSREVFFEIVICRNFEFLICQNHEAKWFFLSSVEHRSLTSDYSNYPIFSTNFRFPWRFNKLGFRSNSCLVDNIVDINCK